ncbi:MAG: YbhB/YbcL family Raf kinase inhibitor-like protein [Candidatus Bathyarchaeota archaeon]|nr:MAG: YbhB/YbcL family Raf kinase inhibitor-like protein [Candidatus Bathyarchaeota archaeon]
MKLKSEDFEDNNIIPSEFTCDGEDISPQLSWEDVPPETKSFALSVTDPDAPGGTWIHWLVYDIPRDVRSIERSSLPKGAKEVENDFGKEEYGGPCPPYGTHRYIFTIYALDTEHLEDVDKHNFFGKVEDHTLNKMVLKGLYKRK